MCSLYDIILMRLASWLIRTAPLNSVHHMVAKTHAFTPCLRGQMQTARHSSRACLLELGASDSLVASRQEVACVGALWQGGGNAAACA